LLPDDKGNLETNSGTNDFQPTGSLNDKNMPDISRLALDDETLDVPSSLDVTTGSRLVRELNENENTAPFSSTRPKNRNENDASQYNPSSTPVQQPNDKNDVIDNALNHMEPSPSTSTNNRSGIENEDPTNAAARQASVGPLSGPQPLWPADSARFEQLYVYFMQSSI
jgi:hypothetical protein